MSRFKEDGTQEPEAPGDLVRVSPPGEPLSPFLTMFFHARGVFPWLYDNGSRQLWWSPEPRSVLFLPELHVSRRLRRTLRSDRFRITADTAFSEVLSSCRSVREPTWITDEMARVANTLHELGHAHSVETWRGDHLVGGIYGIAVGQLFCGYSMFYREPDASKVALVALARRLAIWNFPLIDCHMQSPHLKRMGSRLISRTHFHKLVGLLARGKRPLGPWTGFFP